jgi:lipopolysaccharide transport system permease protein
MNSAPSHANTLPEKVIVPHEGLDAFSDALRSIVRDRRASVGLAWRMFLRDTQATYRQSFLGYIWLLLPALANTLTWVFLTNQNVVNIKTGAVPYALFVFVGNVLWTAFNGGIVGALGMVDQAKSTLSKVNFPHEALVMSTMAKSLLNALATAVFIVPFWLFFPVPLQATIVLFPLGLVCTLICGLALGVLALPFSAMFQDLSRAIQLGLRFVFFLTPVIFLVPSSGWGRTLMLCNPATPLIVTSRAWLVGGETPMLIPFVIISLSGLACLLAGVVMLKVALPHIIERLHA